MAEEQTKTYKAYLVTDEQLMSLEGIRNPAVSEVVNQIKNQHVGSIRSAGYEKVSAAYKSAVEAALAKVEEAKSGRS